MGTLRMGNPLAEGAPKAAATVAAKARKGTARVGSGVETLGDYLRERGLRRPSAEVLQQLAKALRISAETLYIRAGILEVDDSGAREVTVAILGDPHLTERQRQVLIDIYQSFRRENDVSTPTPP